MRRDTIFALATPPGRAGVAVIRVSGDEALAGLRAVTGRPLPEERRLSLRRIMAGRELVDEALVVWFGEGRSFTGEAMVEYHLHGGRAVVSGMVELLGGLDGCRAAEAGEFTRRAFENGRLDLTQVEGIADLIDAETKAQRRQALALVGGELSGKSERWRRTLLEALGLLEASIDFADEEEAPVDVAREVDGLVGGVLAEMEEDLDLSGIGERVREGFRVVLIGRPNVGKSSLFNRIVGREAAITSPVAGTTRDVIEAACDFDGVPVILQDVAGIRDTDDEIEGLGVSRALEVAQAADLRVFLVSHGLEGVSDFVENDDIVVWTKGDLGAGPADVVVSCITGENIGALVSMVSKRLSRRIVSSELVARERQRQRIREACLALREMDRTDMAELKSDALRRSIVALGGLIGQIDAEDVLGEIFSRFCMGK